MIMNAASRFSYRKFSKKTEAAIFVSSQIMLNYKYNAYNKILLHRLETKN